MPAWVQVVIGAAAAVSSLAVLWKQLLRPAAHLVSEIETVLPLLRSLTKELEGIPDAFAILGEIAGEFRNNSGSTLRDVVDEACNASKANRRAIAALNKKLDRVLAQ